MWGPRISSEAITISYWCTSREWVAGISRASCARISIANKILVLRRRTCCQAKQRITFYFGFPWEVACVADALNFLYRWVRGPAATYASGSEVVPQRAHRIYEWSLCFHLRLKWRNENKRGEELQCRGAFLWTPIVRFCFSSYSGIADDATKTFRNDSSLFNLKSEKRKSQNRL